jgi:hypothetical protein
MRICVPIHPPKTDETGAPSRGNRGLLKSSEKRAFFRTIILQLLTLAIARNFVERSSLDSRLMHSDQKVTFAALT